MQNARLSLFVSTLLGFLLPAPAAWSETATYRFVWQGDNGYAMTGALAFDASRVPGRFVREADAMCFVIEGTLEGEPIGRWALGMLNEQTSWRLFFDPVLSAFLVEGQGIRMPQAWNMNGAGDDCGIGGFGFNLGNLGQDFCRDNRVIVESRVDPYAPFPAVRDDGFRFPTDACKGPDLLSYLTE